MLENNLYTIKIETAKYDQYLLYIGKILHDYYTEDKVHLVYEKNILRKKIKRIERMFKKIIFSSEKLQEELQNSLLRDFEDLKERLCDFIILLKWNNFGALRKKILSLCKEKVSIPLTDRENYKALLHILHKGIK